MLIKNTLIFFQIQSQTQMFCFGLDTVTLAALLALSIANALRSLLISC